MWKLTERDLRLKMSKLRNKNLGEKRERKKIAGEIKQLKADMDTRHKRELEACIAQKQATVEEL